MVDIKFETYDGAQTVPDMTARKTAWDQMASAVPLLDDDVALRADLQTHGFCVRRVDFQDGVATLDHAVEELRASSVLARTQPTFGAPRRDPCPRRQINDVKRIALDNPTLLPATYRVVCVLEDVLCRMGLSSPSVPPHRKPHMWRLIGSDASPVSRQQDHCDWDPRRLARLDDDIVPLVVVFALTPHCHIDVCPGTHRGMYEGFERRRVRVRLLQGSFVVFRGDLVHSGSPYHVEAWRLHCDLHAFDDGTRHICAMENEDDAVADDAFLQRFRCEVLNTCGSPPPAYPEAGAHVPPLALTHPSGRPMRSNSTMARINFDSQVY